MANSIRTSRFHFWLWLIAFIGVIVPRGLRADWRQEWEAELRFRETLLAEWDRLDRRNKLDLLRRSLGAFRDALLLQPRRLEDEMFQDLRFGLRMLWKNPGFTAIAALTLALGIGANAAIFSVVDGVLLRPLPYQNADQLVRIWSANPETGQRYLETSYQDFRQFKRQSRGFLAMAAFSEAPRILRDGRGEPGVTLDQADAEVRRVAQLIASANTASGENARRTAWAQTMQAMVAREVRTPLLVLLGAVALVLLIACANVANLLLARGLARRHEIAIRAALGAGRLRIVRQLLIESVLIASLGGALGLLFGAWALKALALLSPDNIPRLNEVALDGRVMAVMVGVTTLAGIIFGLVPALQASKTDLRNAINSGGRGATGGLSKRRLRQGLVIGEVALATVLVISAGLLMRSFGRLVSFDHGFRAENVLVVPIPLRGQVSPQFGAFYEQALAEARALPGVESASLTMRTPMESQGFEFPFRVEGRPALPRTELPQAVIRPISADYFKTVAIPLLSGQTFSDRDRAGAPAVAIINQTFAKTLFPNSEPVGQRLQSEQMEGRSILIVGVAADVTPEAGAASRPAVYLPFSQFPVPGMSLLVRTAGNPIGLVPTIRARIWALDPNVPLDKIYPLEQKVSEATTSPRFIMSLVGLFAALGMALAAVGIYGVMSYSVTERTKEIGIRRALGANEAGIVWAILRRGMTLTLIGLALGLVSAALATRLLTTLLFSVSATDPLTFAGVSSLLVAVALLACYIPARRATKVDPLAALRQD